VTFSQWIGLASELMGVLAVTMLLTISPKFKNQRPLVFTYPLREGVISLLLFGVMLALGFMVYNNPNWVERVVPEGMTTAMARLDQYMALSIAGVLIIAAALIYRRQPVRSAGWNRALLTPALQVGLASIILTIFLRGMLMRLFGGVSSDQINALLFVVLIVIAEETIFRGYIQLRLSGWLGQVPGWLATSGLFVVWQIPRLIGLPTETFLIQLAISLAQGLLAGWMMMKCKHVLAPALYRSASTWLMLLM
jgi:membrane protease YdiL (CAAX protease family)